MRSMMSSAMRAGARQLESKQESTEKSSSINSAANLLTVEKSAGELANYDPRRLTGVSVYRESRAGVFRRRPYSIHRSGQVAWRRQPRPCRHRIRSAGWPHFCPPRQQSSEIEFDAQEHRHFDHGYAVTSHSSQGLTAERVLINADTNVHPDLLNSRFGYVSLSRATLEATLFTDDMTKLRPQLNADVSKTSAIENVQASSRSFGIAMTLE